MSTDKIKAKLGDVAASFIENGMIVGLGTGSTATCFIDSLAKRCERGLQVRAVATSIESARYAQERGICVFEINDVERIDITVDGADKVDKHKRLVKGLGGALLREKIVANASEEMLVMVDEFKMVEDFENFILPVEVISFAYQVTMKKIIAKGYKCAAREKEGDLFVTDNGNMIVDIFFEDKCVNPETDHREIMSIPGVVETGFFFSMAKRVLVGFKEGRVEVFK